MNLSRSRSLPVLTVLLLMAACTSAQTDPAVGEVRPRRDSARLTTQELSQTHATDAYEAIRILRPAWLRQRGQASVTQPSTVMVYVDNVQMGGPEVLRNIPITNITDLQYLDASSATQRWGTNHVHGAILVSTGRM